MTDPLRDPRADWLADHPLRAPACLCGGNVHAHVHVDGHHSSSHLGEFLYVFGLCASCLRGARPSDERPNHCSDCGQSTASPYRPHDPIYGLMLGTCLDGELRNWHFCERCLRRRFDEAAVKPRIDRAYPNGEVRRGLTSYAKERAWWGQVWPVWREQLRAQGLLPPHLDDASGG